MDRYAYAHLRQVLTDLMLHARGTHKRFGERGTTLQTPRIEGGERPTTLATNIADRFVRELSAWCAAAPGYYFGLHTPEFGAVSIGHAGRPLTIWLSSLDGVPAYLDEPVGVRTRDGYGTVLALAEGDAPTFNEVLFSAIERFDTPLALYRDSTGPGETWLRDRNHHTQDRLADVSTTALDPDAHLILSASLAPGVVDTFNAPLEAAGFTVEGSSSCGGSTLNVLTGAALGVAAGPAKMAMAYIGAANWHPTCLPALYHLTVGVGGEVVTQSGLSIGPRDVSTFGRVGADPEYFVLAANPALATDLLARL